MERTPSTEQPLCQVGQTQSDQWLAFGSAMDGARPCHVMAHTPPCAHRTGAQPM